MSGSIADIVDRYDPHQPQRRLRVLLLAVSNFMINWYQGVMDTNLVVPRGSERTGPVGESRCDRMTRGQSPEAAR